MTDRRFQEHKKLTLMIYALMMIAIIVAMDVLFFRHRFRERLAANAATVLLFAVLYLSFAKKPR